MIVFFWGFKDYIHMQVAPSNAIEIRVTGKQWLWQFDYPGGITTIGELTVPVNYPVKLIMTSEDVLHSFYSPNLRVKRDLIPNRYTTLWFQSVKTGNYQLFCTEYCGNEHSAMLATLHVKELSDYERWLKEANLIPADLSLDQVGERVYKAKACFTCHSLDGSVKTGPSWKGLYSSKEKLASGGTITVDDNYLRESIVNPKAHIVAGFQPIMPTFAGLLNDREINGIIEFIKNQK